MLAIKNKFLLLCGISVFLLGLKAILSHYVDLPILIQTNFKFDPIPFNMGILFVLIGISYILLHYKYYRHVKISSVLILFFCFANIIQQLFDFNLGFNPFNLDSSSTHNLFTFLKMAPSSIVCCTLVGVSIFLNTVKINQNLKNWMMAISITILFSICAVNVFGYLFAAELKFKWQSDTKMALKTLFGFFIILSGMVSNFFMSKKIIFKELKNSILATITILFMFILVSFHTLKSDHKNIIDSFKIESQLLNKQLEVFSKKSFDALKRMATRMTLHEAFVHDQWKNEAKIYLNDFTYYESIAWINSKGILEAVYPFKKDSKYVNPHLLNKWTQIRKTSQSKNTFTFLTSNFLIQKSNNFFYLLVPVHFNNKQIGTLTGKISVKRFFDTFNQIIEKKYFSYDIFKDHEVVYNSFSSLIKSNQNHVLSSIDIHNKFFPNLKFSFKTQGVRKHSGLPEIILIFGILFSNIIGAIIYLYRNLMHKKIQLDDTLNTLQRVLDHIPIQLSWKNKDLVFQGASKEFAHYHGFTNNKEVIGKSLHDLHAHSYFLDSNIIRDQNIFNGKQLVFEFEETHFSKDGTPNHFICKKVPLFDKYFNILGVLDTRLDITSRVRAEELLKIEKNNFQKLFEYQPDPSFIIDLEKGIICDCNQAFEKTFNANKDQIIGLSQLDISPEFQDHVNQSSYAYGLQLMEKILQEGKLEFEWIHKKFDGTTFHCIVNVVIMEINQRTIFLSNIKDVSQQKKYEKDLIAAKQKAEKAEKSRAMFLANMSHEIRTPMNGILCMAELLEDNVIIKENQEKIEIIKSSCQTLLGIVNDILDLSKIDAGKLEINLTQVHVHDVVTNMMDVFTKLAEKNKTIFNFIIEPDVPKIILSDPTRLSQILNNLLSNAVKFTHQGNIFLRLSVKSHKENKYNLYFEICDTGIGISEKGMKKLFREFTQEDESTTRRFGGTGLGLTITKKLVEKLGGEIHVVSEKGKGSIFSFTIETEEILEKQKTDMIIPDLTNLKDLKILVVDDNEVNKIVLRKLLRKISISPETANDGQEAVDKTKLGHYDLVFMDCHMPHMDGFEATKIIKNEFENECPIIVAVTASAMQEDYDRAMSAGMDYFLSKPISKNSFHELMIKISSDQKK